MTLIHRGRRRGFHLKVECELCILFDDSKDCWCVNEGDVFKGTDMFLLIGDHSNGDDCSSGEYSFNSNNIICWCGGGDFLV